MDTHTDTTAERLQRRRSRPRVQETEWLQGYLKRRKRDWSAGGNAIGRTRRSRVKISRNLVCLHSFPARYSSQTYTCAHSQPGFARTQVCRPGSIDIIKSGLTQACPSKLDDICGASLNEAKGWAIGTCSYEGLK